MESKKKNILFVENDWSVAVTIKEILERYDFEVTISLRSTEALMFIQSQPKIIDIVISDLHLPNYNGVDLAREIHDVRTDIPFILCTKDKSINEDEIKGMGIINKIFYKPFPLEDFIETINAC